MHCTNVDAHRCKDKDFRMLVEDDVLICIAKWG